MVDIEALERITHLRDSGALTEEEFQREKLRLLDQGVASKRQEERPSGIPVKLALFAAIVVVVALLMILFNREEPNGKAQLEGSTNGTPAYPLDENMLLVPGSETGSTTVSQEYPTVEGTPPKLSSYDISAEGLGSLKLGMSLSEAREASGLDIQNLGYGEGSEPSPEGYQCWGSEKVGFPIMMLAQNGKITVIQIGRTFNDSREVLVTYPEFQTDRGLRLMDSVEKVKRLYSPLEMGDRHSLSYTFWYAKDELGIQFGISSDRVDHMSVGSGELAWFYSEGCSGA